MLNTEGLCLGCMNDNGGEKICPICGFDSSKENPDDCLPLATIIQNRYIIGKVLEKDGEGITYIGWDNSRMAKIKVKEYFPENFAIRNPDKTVSISTDGKYTFNEGLLEFMEINRSIMISTLPALSQIYDVFEENGTAYSVMEFISGITLEEFLEKNGGILKWEQARPLFLPVIDTICGMNEIGYIHGGISAETVIVGRDGKLRITNYTVKKLRRTDSELNYKIYSGYAACEQYGLGEIKIDTYTDVYGLSATLFRVLIGTVPPDASQRITNDVMTIPAKFAGELPRQVLAALANGLQVSPQKRTKNIEIFKNELVYGEIDEPVVKDVSSKSPEKATPSPKKKGSSAKYVLISALCTILVCAIVAAALMSTVFKDVLFGDNAVSSSQHTVSIEAPEVDTLGDMDSGAEVTDKLYVVPNLSGKYYAEIIDNDDYEMFEFEIVGKAFSDKYPKGAVCKQSVKANSDAPRDTKIKITISLGPKEISIANLAGLTEEEAKFELLKQGFIYENIKVLEKYDEEGAPKVVLEQSPKYGEKVSTDIIVEIYINSFEGEESSEIVDTTVNDMENPEITDGDVVDIQ